jgi:hypothetical protein
MKKLRQLSMLNLPPMNLDLHESADSSDFENVYIRQLTAVATHIFEEMRHVEVVFWGSFFVQPNVPLESGLLVFFPGVFHRPVPRGYTEFYDERMAFLVGWEEYHVSWKALLPFRKQVSTQKMHRLHEWIVAKYLEEVEFRFDEGDELDTEDDLEKDY